MSATSRGIKFKFAGFLKGLFQRSNANVAPAETVETETETAAPSAAPAPVPLRSHAANGNGNTRPVVAGLALPLQAILASFPLELRSKIRKQDTDLTINVAFDKILSQLSTGVVKLSYGEIRRAVPQIFAPGIELDTVAVPLPLNEILSRLNPALLTRRPVQKRVEVPAEIESPFAGKGEGLAFGVGTQPEAHAAAAPAVPRARPAIPVTSAIRSGETTTFRRLSPKSMLPAQPVAAAPAAPVAESDAPVFQRKPMLSVTPPVPVLRPRPTPEPVVDEAAVFQRKPVTPPASVTPPPPSEATAPTAPTAPAIEPAAPPRPKDYFANPPVARSMQPAKPAPPAPAATEVVTIAVPLAALAESWPDAVRQEIVQSNLVDARLAMPAEFIEASLKRGRVSFSWKTIRSWIRPATQSSVSMHDATELELPLSVIAPMFVARQKAAGKQQRPAIDETIPNLFFGLPRPEPSHTPKPADTNYYVWGDTNDNARVDTADFKRNGPGGTEFMSRYATPNEIVSRAAALDCVAGVLIALPDGLMVASRIPPEINGDTLAAFLPQIFSKVSQCTKELRMGELNNLNFTIGNVPWKIFRVNSIYFAAFGHAGEPLPSAELAGLAAELDRKRTT